jgi:hypothetical protein
VTFDVTNGRIPDVVERWMRDEFGLVVESGDGTGHLWIGGVLYGVPKAFPWPHDREPTLQEAIEAVMRG